MSSRVGGERVCNKVMTREAGQCRVRKKDIKKQNEKNERTTVFW